MLIKLLRPFKKFAGKCIRLAYKLTYRLFKVDDINHNALLCPEATLKVNTFNSFFNSSIAFAIISLANFNSVESLVDSSDVNQNALLAKIPYNASTLQ